MLGSQLNHSWQRVGSTYEAVIFPCVLAYFLYLDFNLRRTLGLSLCVQLVAVVVLPLPNLEEHHPAKGSYRKYYSAAFQTMQAQYVYILIVGLFWRRELVWM